MRASPLHSLVTPEWPHLQNTIMLGVKVSTYELGKGGATKIQSTGRLESRLEDSKLVFLNMLIPVFLTSLCHEAFFAHLCVAAL